MLEDTGFPAEEIRLLDEDITAGTLTEAGGEPAVVQAVDELSFLNARFVFFTGSPAFTVSHWRSAQQAGAVVIDLSGASVVESGFRPWIPSLDRVLPPLPAQGSMPPGTIISPAAPVIAACSVAAALGSFSVERLAMVFFQSVSERSQAGIQELESQTVKLLSFQPIGQEVFDAQVAFNILDRYGPASSEPLSDARKAVLRDVRWYLEGRACVPAIKLIQVPVFYSSAFAAYAELVSEPEPDAFRRACQAVGMKLAMAGEPLSSVSTAGESRVVVDLPERDPNTTRGYWLWGAADNMRLPAANAVDIAEKLLATVA